MPLSRPDCIPAVINKIWETNPQSLLDVGVGFGGMGVLFRQVMDVRWGRVKKSDWITRIDGIEIEESYDNPVWSVYNGVRIGDAREIMLDLVRNYDVVFFGDILEHFDKKDALDLVKIAKNVSKMVIIKTPGSFSENESEAERFNNEYERHKCFLSENDLPGFSCEIFNNQQFLWSSTL